MVRASLSLNPGALGSDPAFGILGFKCLFLIIDRTVSSHDPRLAELRRLAINTSDFVGKGSGQYIPKFISSHVSFMSDRWVLDNTSLSSFSSHVTCISDRSRRDEFVSILMNIYIRTLDIVDDVMTTR